MSDIAVKIEGIGKKYLIRHNKQKGESYTALRDVLSEGAKKIIQPKSWKGMRGEKEEFWALKDINLEIRKGEKIGIIGKNGAGKSTLLKILSRITAPTEGRIQINGRVSSLLEVGTGFHQELTGRENIYLNGAIMGMSHNEIKKQFDEIVDFSGVENFLDMPVKRYSSGMKTRLGFSVAAHLRNDILILDEVLAVGDAVFQRKCLTAMEDISRSEGRTILFVSHNLAAIQSLCETGIVLDYGSVCVSGLIDNCLWKYNELTTGSGSETYWSRESCIHSPPLTDTEHFVLQEMAFVNEQGTYFEGPFKNNNLPYLQLKVTSLCPEVGIGILVSDEIGHSIFASTHLDNGDILDPLAGIDKVQNDLTIRVKIPNHFLNEGYYRVAPLFFFKHGGSILHPKRDRNLQHLALSIEGGLSPSSFFQRKREGSNAPLLQWKTV